MGLPPGVGRVEGRLRVPLLQQVTGHQALRYKVAVQLQRRHLAPGGALRQVPLWLRLEVDVDYLVSEEEEVRKDDQRAAAKKSIRYFSKPGTTFGMLHFTRI